MILEVAVLNVRPGMSGAFEEAFRQASSIISAMPGYISHQLQRCIEEPDRYVLLVNWQTLEAHTVGFRGSADYQEWKRLLHHFYDPFPTVEHYESGVSDAAMPRDVMEFLEQYRDAFNRLDGAAIAELYCVPSAIVSDRGLTTWQSRKPIAENMSALCNLYRENGYKHARFRPLHFISQGAAFAVADVEWTIERQPDADPWRFRTTYNIRRDVDGWRVVLCTAYEEKRLNA